MASFASVRSKKYLNDICEPKWAVKCLLEVTWKEEVVPEEGQKDHSKVILTC